MSLSTERIAANLSSVRQRIGEAARKSGRHANQVTLVAITKYVDADAARAIASLGCVDLGESRPQELWAKAAATDDPGIRWHHVGHLQTNKLARTLPLIHLLHSVDSQHLLEAIDQQARRLGGTIDCLFEVNISGDQNKHGFQPTDVAETVRNADRFPNVRLRGLMAMGSLEGGLDQTRRDFESLRILRDSIRGDCPPTLDQLSMGMSGDFEVAIEEGATIVRIGSALFE